MAVKQISVFLENKFGSVEELTGLLAHNNIGMRALSLAETKEFGIVRLIVDDVYEATTVLKDADFIHSITPVIAVTIEDKVGALHEVLEVLAKERINVEYMYSTMGGPTKNSAYIIFRVDDIEKAEAVLKKSGFKLTDQDAIGV